MVRTALGLVGSALVAAAPTLVLASPELDPAFGSGMVLQRDRAIPIGGSARPDTQVTIVYDAFRTSVRSDASGRWHATLPPRSAGGPVTLEASDPSGTTRLVDILIGDVWLCSGQSNMEFTLRHATNAETEIAGAEISGLRLLAMPRQSSAVEQVRPASAITWQRSDPTSAADFSAACWIMGRELQQRQGIPIGLIAASWGGSMIEEWLDRTTLAQVPRYREPLAWLDAWRSNPDRGHALWRAAFERWLGARTAPPVDAVWVSVPRFSFWEDWGSETAYFDGIGYYRAVVTVPPGRASAATLELAAVDDLDATRINGVAIGAGQGWNTPRRYSVPEGVLKDGANTIEITVVDSGGGGGIWGAAPVLRLADGIELPIEQARFAKGANLGALGSAPAMPWIGGSGVTTLFNGMIAPLGRFPVKGFAWYQGEANVGDPDGYRELLPLLARQWRQRFGGDAFVMVQLSSFGPLAARPSDNAWGRFRDTQRRIAAENPGIGLASAIDVGQVDDIHPTNKQTVGRRMALEARRIALSEPIISRGPDPVAVSRRNGRIVVRFANGPLQVMGSDTVIGFELCAPVGACRFVSGVAEGNSVVLPDDPVATRVRYLWQASPIVNLYNADGLPATPFELPIAR